MWNTSFTSSKFQFLAESMIFMFYWIELMLLVLASNDLFSRCFMFYGRYVDNTLVVIKSGDLNGVHNALNDFDPNIKFTLDTFDDVVSHFLDM